MSQKYNCNIENSQLLFIDMENRSWRNGGDSVNNEATGQVVFQIAAIH